MSNKSVILSAGDSFATFDTYDCENPEIRYSECHAVQIIADKYNVDAHNGGIPGGGTQDSVAETLYNIHNVPNIKLIFFHISHKSRIPIDDNDDLDIKLNHLGDYYSLENLDPMPLYKNPTVDKIDIADILSALPLFKLDLDDIAYLSLLVQICKIKDIGIIFVSEFLDVKRAWMDLTTMFSSEPHVRISDNLLCSESKLNKSNHKHGQLRGNHLCQHYQEYLANEYLDRYSEFISDSLL